MAKKTQLSYNEIEDRLRFFKNSPVSGTDIGYHLLYAFGKSEREIERYKEGKGVIGAFDGLLVKGLLCYKSDSTLRFASVLEDLKQNAKVLKAAPKIIAVSDGETIRAYDLRRRQTFEQKVSRLYCDFEFFYPLSGRELVEYDEESPADIKAAEKLAKLHDEIRAYNEFSSDSDIHDLNTFMACLLFCFFAEDTGIFEDSVFTNAIKVFTDDGRELKNVLEQIFSYMGGRNVPAGTLRTYCQERFNYVGGGLFDRSINIPELSNRAQQIIIESGELDWQNINPDIFGSMIQAVVNPEERATQGMHYTSVPNILKVINPLFMDELRGEYKSIEDDFNEANRQKELATISDGQFVNLCKPITRRCDKLLKRMMNMKLFDPACGSGNFLIIAYKMLRLLEMDILAIKKKCTRMYDVAFIDISYINLNQFYGIELLDFPHEVAMLSLWLAEHQMNRKMNQEFGMNRNALPLQEINNIKRGNACRMDWNEVCPHGAEEEVFVLGNPPYLGSKRQDASQKSDVENVFHGVRNSKMLDYIGIWIYEGARYVANSMARCAFVSTNSICQGEQVSVLWPLVFNKGVEIDFAYTSFKWSNNARNRAGVTCVIVGISSRHPAERFLFTGDRRMSCRYISPYLTGGTATIVHKCASSPRGIPKLCFGCMPYDNGNLLMDGDEYNDFISQYPDDARFVKRIYGSDEFINDKLRYCLWIDDDEREEAERNPCIKSRIEATRLSRMESKDGAALAERPHQFREHPELVHEKIIIPRVSSERRPYIPMGYLKPDEVVSDSAFAIYDAPLWLFGILTSRIHMCWVRAVGGRLETRYRYSAGLCYNTFPFPRLSGKKQADIEEAATDVLMARQDYLTKGKTLADLYDPDEMPEILRLAHERLDSVVESCYPGSPFYSDEARLECLFRLYENVTKQSKDS